MVQKKSRVILKKSVHFVRAQVRIPYCFVIMSDSSENSLLGNDVVERPVRLQTVIQHASKRTCWCFWKSCGIVFESLDQLADHVTQVHSSSGPGGLFYCGWEGCTRNDKGFNARYKMLVHVRTHTNQKPHECFQCHKSFSRAENLKIHFRSHSGEKPYVCPLPGCNKAYSNSSDRFKHTRTHQIEKPYTCKVTGCSKRYTDPSSLRKHVKTYKHNIQNQDDAAGQNAPFFIDPTNAQMCYQKNNLWKEFLDIDEESTRLSRNSCDKFWDMPMDLRINQNSK